MNAVTWQAAAALFGAMLLTDIAHGDALRERTIEAQSAYQNAQRDEEQAKKARDEAKTDFINLLEGFDPQAVKKACPEWTQTKKGQASSAKACAESIQQLTKSIPSEATGKPEAGVPSLVPGQEPDALAPASQVGPLDTTTVAESDAAALCGEMTSPDCTKQADTLVSRADDLLQKEAELTRQRGAVASAAARMLAAVKLESNAVSPKQSKTLASRLAGPRQVRCYVALCWGGEDGTKYAIEPILDLPVSMFWGLGNGGLANHINANQLQITVTAGIRYWFAYDLMSVGLILAQPNLTNGGPIYIEHSAEQFPKEALARPFPTLALGVWGDVFMFTLSYDQLRNTDGSKAVDLRYRFEEVVARTFTLGVSLNIATGIKSAVVALGANNELETK